MSHTSDTIRAMTYPVALKGGFDTATLTGDVTLTKRSGQHQKLDPGGSARDVTLPSVSAQDDGYHFWIGNAADAAENLVVKNAAGSTVVTVNQSEAALVYVTAAGAWATFGVFTFAAS